MYTRVIPRDLFNEAKLLKCYGQLALHIHNGDCPPGLLIEHTNTWRVDQHPDCGGLYFSFGMIVSAGGMRLDLRTTYNSKLAYPLLCTDTKDGVFYVFTDDGVFTSEFSEYCRKLFVESTGGK